MFLSGEAQRGEQREAMKDGAIDFLEKPVDADALLAAVMRALAREAEWRLPRRDRMDARAPARRPHPPGAEVMLQVACGRSNKQIAAELGTSEKTIKVHRGRVMHKLGAASVVDVRPHRRASRGHLG